VDIADNMVQLESLTKTSASLRLGKSASAATLGNAASSATLRHSVSAAAMPHRSMHGSGMMSQTSLSGGLGMSFSNDGLSVVQREMNALVYNTAVTRINAARSWPPTSSGTGATPADGSSTTSTARRCAW